MAVSWEGTAQAVRCALEAPELPSPCERFHYVMPVTVLTP